MEPLIPQLLPTPFGLVNKTGAMCYYNAMMQALLSCTSLFRIIKRKGMLTKLASDELLSKFNNGRTQESASESFIKLIEFLDDKDINDLLEHRYEEQIICNNCDKIHSKTSDTSYHFEVFDEQLVKQMGVKDALLNAVNDIPDYKDTCKHCQGTSFRRRYKLKYIPEIVVVLFNKYAHKSIIHVDDTFCINGSDGEPIKYKRVSEVHHFGSLNGGHYVAKALRKDNNVYLFNDNNYNKSTFEDCRETYMVIYHYVV